MAFLCPSKDQSTIVREDIEAIKALGQPNFSRGLQRSIFAPILTNYFAPSTAMKCYILQQYWLYLLYHSSSYLTINWKFVFFHWIKTWDSNWTSVDINAQMRWQMLYYRIIISPTRGKTDWNSRKTLLFRIVTIPEHCNQLLSPLGMHRTNKTQRMNQNQNPPN